MKVELELIDEVGDKIVVASLLSQLDCLPDHEDEDYYADLRCAMILVLEYYGYE